VTTVPGTKVGTPERPPATSTQAGPVPDALPHTGAGLLFAARPAPVRLLRG
jgi:hypothetical protein